PSPSTGSKLIRDGICLACRLRGRIALIYGFNPQPYLRSRRRLRVPRRGYQLPWEGQLWLAARRGGEPVRRRRRGRSRGGDLRARRRGRDGRPPPGAARLRRGQAVRGAGEPVGYGRVPRGAAGGEQ